MYKWHYKLWYFEDDEAQVKPKVSPRLISLIIMKSILAGGVAALATLTSTVTAHCETNSLCDVYVLQESS